MNRRLWIAGSFLLMIGIWLLSWWLVPSKLASTWIVDKTVPQGDYREHKGLMWALNYFKVRNEATNQPFDYTKDYYGYHPEAPKAAEVKPLPPPNVKQKPDLIYLADTYGVYQSESPAPNRSALIYGGLQEEDVRAIEANLRHNVLIAEYNTMSSPTKPQARKQMEAILGVRLSGWAGSYFSDLVAGKEVPDWLVQQYEAYTGQKWSFSGAGYAFVSDEQQVIVLQAGMDVGANGLQVIPVASHQQEFNLPDSTPYDYWFELVTPESGSEVIANYQLDLTTLGKEKLAKLGMPSQIPAILRRHVLDYTTYYFAGDFADNNKVPSYWQVYGVAWLKKWLTPYQKGEPDAFYWRCYLPLMNKILAEVQAKRDEREAPVIPAAIQQKNGIKQVSTVLDEKLQVYTSTGWTSVPFWGGVNLGASSPGHFPGEVKQTRQDYLRWFPQMKALHAKVLRVYTIMPPAFYQALADYNETQQEPLWLIQGIWSPEEALIGEDRLGRDAFTQAIRQEFHDEITDSVKAVHGDLVRPPRKGVAYGTFRADVSPYLLGWIVGTEWYPYAVGVTNLAHPGMKPFHGTYAWAKPTASPFESWLAEQLEVVAQTEMKYGWQHPIAFANWVTTDPMSHPEEPFAKEDLVSVDPLHIQMTDKWHAGYFASYHVYPYYPDFLRFTPSYQTYRDKRGNVNPYAGYLHDLKSHTQGIPLFISEFGVPSSRGMAHSGPLGRNQGMHSEQEQGRINADLLRSIYDEGCNGGILFSWQDEWFKFTWNTIDLELPEDRRAMWRNRLTNEENFGLIAVEPGRTIKDTIILDGQTDDWMRRAHTLHGSTIDVEYAVSSDEAYVYILAKKREGSWNPGQMNFSLGFDTLAGGGTFINQEPGIHYPKGAEFFLQLKSTTDAHIYVNSGYDQHTWLYEKVLHMLPYHLAYENDQAGIFLPWNLALSRELFLPQTKRRIPFEQLEVGKLFYGTSDPTNPAFASLTDWYAAGEVLELRIPWMLLGFTDPSSHQVWQYPYKAMQIAPITTTGIRVMTADGQSLLYQWEGWDEPVYHERKKPSYDIMQRVFEELSAGK